MTAPAPPPDWNAADAPLMTVEFLHWPRGRRDVIAAARMTAHREPAHELVGAFDVYLLTNGWVDIWEDLSDDPTVAAYQRPHRDWYWSLPSLMRAVMAESVTKP